MKMLLEYPLRYLGAFFLSIGWIIYLIPIYIIPKVALIIWYFRDKYHFRFRFQEYDQSPDFIETPLRSDRYYHYRTYLHYIWDIKRGGMEDR